MKQQNHCAPFVRSPYNYDTNAASNRSGLLCEDSSLTEQHHGEDADINVIVSRFLKTGEMPQNAIEPRYGDFSDVVDYHTALNAVIAAEAQFDALPAKLKDRFSNDPQELMNFLQNQANRDEAIALGLIDPPSPFSKGLPEDQPIPQKNSENGADQA